MSKHRANCHDSPGTQIIRDYLASNPSLPTRTIARHIFSKHKGIWSNAEAIRKSVSAFRGANGKKARRDSIVIAAPSPLSNWKQAIELNPFYCPPSDAVDWKPFVVPVAKEDETMILSDIHLPYHDPVALKAAIKEGKRRGISRILLNGDTLDFYQLSRFGKDPRLRSFASEIEMAKTFLESLREQFPNAEIIWKHGNHEERFEHYLQNNAKELIGVDEFRFEVLMGFFDLGVKFVTDKRPIQLGKNNILHGHEHAQGMIPSVNPARGLFLKAKTNAACGHHHQVSDHSEPNLKGEVIACWSTGCLCDLHPAYMPINKWSHGFAFQRTAPDGSFEFENRRIINGRLT